MRKISLKKNKKTVSKHETIKAVYLSIIIHLLKILIIKRKKGKVLYKKALKRRLYIIS